MKKLITILLCLPMIGFGQTAYDYYIQGIEYQNLGEYQLAINNYTKAINEYPDYAPAYYNRGITYNKLGKYEDAIADFSRVICVGIHFEIANNELVNYEHAIADYTRDIRIDLTAYAYLNRGIAKWYLKLSYCSDFKQACDLGLCDNYNDLCK
jgi:tetratricopeptide (TPR) repeat protein|tara:strand:- start:1255 stop:1713 length:459 start_codon:yes stop_codon:yes gene_type:complete